MPGIEPGSIEASYANRHVHSLPSFNRGLPADESSQAYPAFVVLRRPRGASTEFVRVIMPA